MNQETRTTPTSKEISSDLSSKKPTPNFEDTAEGLVFKVKSAGSQPAIEITTGQKVRIVETSPEIYAYFNPELTGPFFVMGNPAVIVCRYGEKEMIVKRMQSPQTAEEFNFPKA
jgi:hypothetical protein